MSTARLKHRPMRSPTQRGQSVRASVKQHRRKSDGSREKNPRKETSSNTTQKSRRAEDEAQQVAPVPLPAASPRKQERLSGLTAFFREFTIEKMFIIFGFLVAACLVVTFGCDLILGWPFYRASTLFDVSAVIGGLSLAYLSWNAAQDV